MLKWFEKNKNISCTKEDSKIILEKPIQNKDDDMFGITPYVNQLNNACDDGAIFIAIDGKYGSGKSSIIKLFEEEKKDKKNKFVNINFLNINQINTDTEKKQEKEDLKETIDRYHRYFVNQVANDICKNPYDIDRMFYNSSFTYATINSKKGSWRKIFLDKTILFLISFISIFMVYASLFKDEHSVYYNIYLEANKYFPLTLLVTAILILIYGYGFFKPDKTEHSPLLDIDKCRNIFLKVLNDYILSNSTIYLIIDDLDRVSDEKIQLGIISLLFNEYYPLNKVLKGISIKFIFMVDIEKLQYDENKEETSNKFQEEKNINPNKIFDYILTVSSNQKNILKYYLEKTIQSNNLLTEIFDNSVNKNYLFGIIISNFKDIRSIKHLLNNILTKYMYLKNKEITFNYEQLIIVNILVSKINVETLIDKIDSFLNGTKPGIKDEKTNFLNTIVKEAIELKIINKNYYIYIYNFIDETNLFNSSEQKIIDLIMNNDFDSLKGNNVKEIRELLESNETRFTIIYEECYKYLSNTNKINILLGNKSYFEFMSNHYEIDIEKLLLNGYINPYFVQFYENVSNDIDEKGKLIVISNLSKINTDYLETNNDEIYEMLKEDFISFVKNLGGYITDFKINDILSNIKIDDDIYSILMKTYNKENKYPIIYDLIIENRFPLNKMVDRINYNFIKILKDIDAVKAFELEDLILSCDEISKNLKIDILVKEENLFENLPDYVDDINSDENIYMSIGQLKTIMNRYGYGAFFDRHIIKLLDDISERTISYIKTNEFELSKAVLNKIDSIKYAYDFPKYYEDLFLKEKYYKLYIYSQAKKSKQFKLNTALRFNEDYIKSLGEVYLNMGNFNIYIFTPGFTNKIVDSFDFNRITYNNSNFWKIDILYQSLNSPSERVKVFDRLKANNNISAYCIYCKRNQKIKNTDFLENLNLYASEHGVTQGIKGTITKTIKHVKKRVSS